MTKDNFEKTEAFNELSDYLEYKYYSIGRKLGRRLPGSIRSVQNKKLYRVRKGEPSSIILVDKGILAPLKKKYVSYNLAKGIQDIEDPSARAALSVVGALAIFSFARNTLHIGACRLVLTPV